MNATPPSRFVLPAACFAVGLLVAGLGFRLVPGILGLESPAVSSPAAVSAPRPLAWSEIVDANTATFAENLRGIGCPEDTIMRIVTSGPRLAEPVAAVPEVSPAAPATMAPPALPAAVAAPVPAVAVAVAAPVLSAPPAPSQPEVVIVAPAGAVPLPVAFQPLPQDAGMTPAQTAQLNAIQEEFIAAIGGPNQDPASPEYRDRWRQAQRKSDAAFKAAFGQGAFVRRQMAMVREANSAVPGS